MTVADYMLAALADPVDGYYMRGDPFGRAGDFVTAPEISQMFGELIGLWCAHCWQAMGRPDAVHLVELGPGRGTLMADLLRAAQAWPAFLAALDIHLVEISPALRAVQQATLARRAPGIRAAWHGDMGALPAGPMLLVANEFFDALPMHQFVWTERGWRERLIETDGEAFRFTLAAAATPMAALLPAALSAPAAGAVAEVSPATLSFAALIGRRVASQGGAALIVDYGAGESGLGDSLQALRRHRRHAVLDQPGQADLTAHVDFQVLARSAREAGATCHGPLAQGLFLTRLGIAERARRLARQASAAQVLDIESARRRLIEPEQMGSLFKALAIAHPALATPAGFAGGGDDVRTDR